MSEERLDDDRLRAAYAQAVAARGAPARDGCPDPDALLALVRRDGPEAARLHTLDHAMLCPECRREFELLRAIERVGGMDTAHAVERLRWRRVAVVGLAATAVLAVGLGPGRPLWSGRDEPVLRGEADIALVAPVPSEAAPVSTPLTFTWRPVPGARRYTVELLAADGTVALGGETADTTLTLAPPASLAAGEYRWLVSAQAADGATTRSAARPLRLLRP